MRVCLLAGTGLYITLPSPPLKLPHTCVSSIKSQ